MTSQEEQMLNSLVERVNAAKLTEKDLDAEALLQRGFGSNPDAFYVLAQSVLVQNIALERAHAQLTESQNRVVELQQKVEQLQTQAQQSAHSTSFLGNLLGHRDPAPGAPPPPPAQPAYQQDSQQGSQQGYRPVYTPPPAQGYQAPYNPAPQYAGPQFASLPEGPSFLGTAVATAAGVAAGALLFEGVEDILYGGYRRPGFGYGYGYPGYGVGIGGWGMPGIGMGFGPEVIVEQPIIEQPVYEQPVHETVVENNYYEAPNDSGGGNFQDTGQDTSWNDDSGSGYDSGSDSGGFDSGGFDGGSGGDSGGF